MSDEVKVVGCLVCLVLVFAAIGAITFALWSFSWQLAVVFLATVVIVVAFAAVAGMTG